MASKIQLDLFMEEDELSLMRKELKEVYLQQEKLKRALSSRHHDLSRLCLQLKEENELLKFRLDKLESAMQKSSSASNDDLLEKLFKEAYLL